MDFKNALLKCDLHEEAHISPLLGIAHQPDEVYRLWKALHGLRQAPLAWFDKKFIVITSLGFQSSCHDSALFVRFYD